MFPNNADSFNHLLSYYSPGFPQQNQGDQIGYRGGPGYAVGGGDTMGFQVPTEGNTLGFQWGGFGDQIGYRGGFGEGNIIGSRGGPGYAVGGGSTIGFRTPSEGDSIGYRVGGQDESQNELARLLQMQGGQ